MTDWRLVSEFLPATEAARQNLVLLHGWGCTREIWRPLVAKIRGWANLTLVDLPGCSMSQRPHSESSLDSLLDAILAIAPPQAVYVGWSLGGQLAAALAERSPQRVTALITACSNPKFVGEGEWPGMEAATLADFHTRILANPAAGLRRFDSLQLAGASSARHWRQQLGGQREAPDGQTLLQGLDWLATWDQRSLLANLRQPQLHVLAEKDGLLPAELLPALTTLLSDRDAAEVQSLGPVSHVLPLEAPMELARSIENFLYSAGLLTAVQESDHLLAKQDIADSFSRAARHYDSVAVLQRNVGDRLLQQLDQLPCSPSTVLDLGCGTGHFYPPLRERFPAADYIGLDLAPGMVSYARERFAQEQGWLVADAEVLPLAPDSVDLVFSSLAIQWCDRPEQLFAELARVLRPGGHCVFTSLGPATLCELRAAWAAVDQHQHVNTFLPVTRLEQAAQNVPSVRLSLDSVPFRMEYERVRDLLTELKTLGAHNMNHGRPQGLTGRRSLQGMLAAYENYRENGKLPATYDVIFAVLEKI